MKKNKENNFLKNRIFHFETNSNRLKLFKSIDKKDKINTFTINNKSKKKSPKFIKRNLTNDEINFMKQRIKKSNNKNYEKDEIKKSMGQIINKLILLKTEINKINSADKEKLNIFKLYNPINNFKYKTLKKSKTKNKYLLYINDYYKNKHKLFLQNKIINSEIINKNIINKEENELNIKNYKENEDSTKNMKSLKSFDELNLFKNNNIINDKKKLKPNFFSLDNISFISNNKTIEKKYYSENKNNLNSNKIIQNHMKYIEKIKDNELMDLIKRYKKSLNKNKIEELFHYRSLVFPAPLINYLIKLKKELIIDKYRNEYIKKIERYNTNNIFNEFTII